ncbi:MAG: hypothetical protein HC835_13045 [Oscillatoriales cyanobacterium RM2_1_1]|nr:hypothetical protein [Oscillatoriales cyanobacterium SM2_3_0]NJO46475.1 hypothetical protein [Oscillatoriales cyanobacterium RM2_1_1]
MLRHSFTTQRNSISPTGAQKLSTGASAHAPGHESQIVENLPIQKGFGTKLYWRLNRSISWIVGYIASFFLPENHG